MSAHSIEPLRKTNADGVLYTRLPATEEMLATLQSLSPKERGKRCTIDDKDDPNYVRSECLVTLIRQYRSQELDECGEIIFHALMKRLLKGLPEPVYANGNKEDSWNGQIQEEARYRFLEMLIRDRQVEYVETLDFYEIRFARAVKMLRIDAKRKVNPKQAPLESLEIDEESGDFSPEIEKATAIPDPFDPKNLSNSDYRLALDAAISDLPDIQKAVVEMLRIGIPIESKEPGTVNISTVLKKTPKTIATYRDKAFATLRVKMTKGEEV